MVSLSLLLCSCIRQWDPEPEGLQYIYTDIYGRDLFKNNISTMTDFIFDKDSILQRVREIPSTELRLRSMPELPEGDYTVITWCNLTPRNTMTELHEGVTHMRDIRLKAAGEGAVTGSYGNGDRLFYATTQVTVQAGKLPRQTVRVSHAHHWMHLIIRWKQQSLPSIREGLNVRLEGAPGNYGFTSSSYSAPIGGINQPSHKGGNKVGEEATWNFPVASDAVVVSHSVSGSIKPGGEASIDMICHRYTQEQIPTLCIYDGDRPLIPAIDLRRFFREMDMNMDRNICQEFDFLMVIDEKGATLSSGIMNWEDGGTIG